MRTIPIAPIRWPLFRLLTRASWGGQLTSGTNWKIWPMRKRSLLNGFGFLLHDLERHALPMVGRCRLSYDFGVFAERTVGISDLSQTRLRAGEAWDPDIDGTNAPDLTGQEIRVQAAPSVPDDTTSVPAWRTVWWGQCDFIQDSGAPGASIPMGRRTYHCTDALFRVDRWVMNRHGLSVVDEGGGTSLFDNCIGNPGYNVTQEGRSARLAKNRSGSQYPVNAGGGGEDPLVMADSHSMPSAGSTAWTDQEAVEHALRATRPAGEPLFSMTGSVGLFGAAHPWRVEDDQSVHDFIVKICRRQRGRGCVFVSWDDDSGAPDGPLTARLVARPMFKDALTFNHFNGAIVSGTTTLPGAVTTGSTMVVDLIGDHRVVDDAFQICERTSAEYDYLETVGERIQIVINMAYVDSPDGNGNGVCLAKRWSASDQTTFRALSLDNRKVALWSHVYQIHGLPRAWGGKSGNGNNSAINRVDFRCIDSGLVSIPASDAAADTSPALVKVLPDLPLYQGYTCTGSTYVRKDGAAENGDPQREKMRLLIRTASDRYLMGEQISLQSNDTHLSAHLDDDGILVMDGNDEPKGTRVIGSKSAGVSPDNLNSEYDYTQLAILAALELPHRVRMASGISSGKRRLTIHHPNMHLWLIASNAIYDLDPSVGTAATGFGARRSALGSSGTIPGFLRDDRDNLLEMHTLAAAYYLNVRRPTSWAIRDCALFPTYDAYEESNPDFSEAPTAFPNPTLGQFVTTIAANGETHIVNCPVTSIVYDNTSGETRFDCDWSQLDLESF